MNTTECDICLETIGTNQFETLANCGHSIHKSCLQKIINHNLKNERRNNICCPFCRTPISKDVISLYEFIEKMTNIEKTFKFNINNTNAFKIKEKKFYKFNRTRYDVHIYNNSYIQEYINSIMNNNNNDNNSYESNININITNLGLS
tara:strand:- start:33 stop:473 length:441 start_codon:yes stop_codon:yes gene_type:complete